MATKASSVSKISFGDLLIVVKIIQLTKFIAVLIWPMQLVEINVVRLKSLETPVNGSLSDSSIQAGLAKPSMGNLDH